MQTPARRLKDDISTGHAASPVTIVVGKAHMRTNQSCGAAPKMVPNIALFKKDMKMDEDFTGLLSIVENNVCNKCSVKLFVQILNVIFVLLGVADIFKTPANSRSKNKVPINDECPEMPLDDISVMKTPEESGYCFGLVSVYLLCIVLKLLISCPCFSLLTQVKWLSLH